MNLVELSQRIKRLRTERGLTLEQVAAQAGLTRGWLSKVENFRLTPSLTALAGIAEALGVTMADLFTGLDRRPPLAIVRRDERLPMRRDEEVSQYLYESLAHSRPSRRMDPFVLTVPHNDPRPMLAHAGEEFLLVLAGTVDLEYADQRHPLAEGDAAYFDGDRPHRLVCTSVDHARVLVVYHGVAAEEPAEPNGT